MPQDPRSSPPTSARADMGASATSVLAGRGEPAGHPRPLPDRPHIRRRASMAAWLRGGHSPLVVSLSARGSFFKISSEIGGS